jgi:hypothetical protein
MRVAFRGAPTGDLVDHDPASRPAPSTSIEANA